ncbi:hypothetical protein GGX14DRAFT_600753 [Mycena pura]|uniref:Uncharacterized protein n=1 Tax=Mycena pura TaxID=153505 RepID=A0AAD6XXA9_9AGAR|nr:hypothetical protein GGX14DRAFT_600753 [Mycena pura]
MRFCDSQSETGGNGLETGQAAAIDFIVLITDGRSCWDDGESTISNLVTYLRSDDTATLKRLIPDLVTINPSTPLDPPLADKKSKAHRGFAHPVFGLEIPVGAESDDPAWVTVMDDAMKGEVLLKSAKAICMGPNAAFEGDGWHKGKPGNAHIVGMTSFTPRVMAWITAQVYFALSSQQEWYKTDGNDFSYEDFFYTICDLLDESKDKEWVDEVIALWDRVVLGKKAVTKPIPARQTDTRAHALERLKAARAARLQRSRALTAGADAVA